MGLLVDENNEPLKPKIKELKKQINSHEVNDDEKEELEEQLSQLYQEAKVLIDLTGKSTSIPIAATYRDMGHFKTDSIS